ncbi:ubiquinone biosynthesis accessory factor UbiJ [Haliea sp. E17]|uniref:ubiquinone biosynthesis accessory factor UbiJ n=1 Tax=Haliea sp. E17 TaxID=3401576 RepID=UPI003AAE0426
MSAQIDPTLHTAALAAVEALLNRALQLSPGGSQALAALEGQVFALHCTAPQLDAFLQPAASGVRLMGAWEGDVTTSLRGEASEFAALATADDPAAALINGGLELRGDSAALIELQKIIAGLDPDWEAPLVNTLGDVAGHQVAQMLRGGFRWGRQAGAGLSRQLAEFIQEEARLTPPRLELEDFYRDVQDLCLRVDRLNSRIARLRRKTSDYKDRS